MKIDIYAVPTSGPTVNMLLGSIERTADGDTFTSVSQFKDWAKNPTFVKEGDEVIATFPNGKKFALTKITAAHYNEEL